MAGYSRRAFRPAPRQRAKRSARAISPLLIVAPLAILTAVLTWDGAPPAAD
ncbi:MAG: hypothetical protein P8J20_01860 [Novosphingobium sp.]|nr:hypothetical protein [Novosphingobium sp.]